MSISNLTISQTPVAVRGSSESSIHGNEHPQNFSSSFETTDSNKQDTWISQYFDALEILRENLSKEGTTFTLNEAGRALVEQNGLNGVSGIVELARRTLRSGAQSQSSRTDTLMQAPAESFLLNNIQENLPAQSLSTTQLRGNSSLGGFNGERQAQNFSTSGNSLGSRKLDGWISQNIDKTEVLKNNLMRKVDTFALTREGEEYVNRHNREGVSGLVELVKKNLGNRVVG